MVPISTEWLITGTMWLPAKHALQKKIVYNYLAEPHGII